MSVFLITGQPGHGKTAYGLTMGRKYKADGRNVYAHGVKDLDYDKIGFHRLDDPKRWFDLPDGSVILIDECYTTFPNRNSGSAVPEHVQQMAVHRHRGFDFILIAQQGLQIDPFLRGLYESHWHCRNAWAGKTTKIKRWDQYQSNVKAQSVDTIRWIRPDEIFTFYTSTTLNTRKRRLPTWAWYVLIGLAVATAVILLARHRMMTKYAPDTSDARSSSAVGGAPSGAGPTAGGARVAYASPADYANAHLPRIASMPWTAPIYDQRQPMSDPQILCMYGEPGQGATGHLQRSCTCFTEQGTRIDMQIDQCWNVARYGGAYNPYKSTQQQQPVTPAPVEPVASRQPHEYVPSLAMPATPSTEQQARYGQFRSDPIGSDPQI